MSWSSCGSKIFGPRRSHAPSNPLRREGGGGGGTWERGLHGVDGNPQQVLICMCVHPQVFRELNDLQRSRFMCLRRSPASAPPRL